MDKEQLEFKTYYCKQYKGVSDLLEEYAWTGSWGQGDHSYTNDIKEVQSYMSFNFKGIDPKDSKAVLEESNRRKELNSEYLKELKTSGEYMKELEPIKITMQTFPEFDEPKYPKNQPMESYRMVLINIGNNE